MAYTPFAADDGQRAAPLCAAAECGVERVADRLSPGDRSSVDESKSNTGNVPVSDLGALR